MTVYYLSLAEDFREVLELRERIEADLRQRGIDQWHGTQAHGHEALRTWISRRTLTTLRDRNGNLIGTVGLDGPDRDFWTSDEAAEPALYVYKMMIHPDFRRRGIGDALLDWCGLQARSGGNSLLRLDCNRNNTSLHQYWKDRGFEQVALRSTPGRQSGALFQRAANIATATDAVTLMPAEESGGDRYDPEGTAAVWLDASNAVGSLQLSTTPGGEHDWNSAITQAARVLETRASEIRRNCGLSSRSPARRRSLCDDTPPT
ncbi:GNAT family N-acetyltransferase [Saccharopolyspora cebuensis]|uniref:GNAT family N-acetyltransferase n=1 Tax=Saccharopolyspora cebuensis TaxID=418759 RepID=UPI0031E4ED86